MFKLFKTLMLIIWIIDILNINFIIAGVSVAEFLDVTIPINGWFWFLFWILVPSSEAVMIKTKGE